MRNVVDFYQKAPLVFRYERENQNLDASCRLEVGTSAVAMVPPVHEPMTEREELEFRVLRALGGDPEMSQRELARTTGFSLGAVNYCLKALIEKGLIKVQNFRQSNNKLRYAYVLTPQGASAKSRLTMEFLKRKLSEYERLQNEIKDVIQEFEEQAVQDRLK